jgi:phage terminase small subunit
VAAKKTNKKRVNAGVSKASAAEKRAAFVEAFLSNGENATKAAIAAGFSEKTAGSAGARLLKNVEISTALNKRRTEVLANLQLNTEKTILEVARLAFSDPRKIANEDGSFKQLHELDDDTAAAVASYEVDKDGGVKYKFWDKNSALDKAAKVQGLFEKDNLQRGGALADLPRETVKAIVDRLRLANVSSR